jgi:di/tripeptidase
MTEKKPSKTAMDARDCMEKAIHDELVKKAKLGQDVIINRNGKPYKVSAAEALRIQEESPDYKVG